MSATESLRATFPVYMDGQQMAMAELALKEKADRCDSPTVAAMYRVEARKYEAARKQFHAQTYHIMAPMYHLPQLKR